MNNAFVLILICEYAIEIKDTLSQVVGYDI